MVVRGRYRKGLRLIILILFNPVRSIYPSRTYNLSQESLNGGVRLDTGTMCHNSLILCLHRSRPRSAEDQPRIVDRDVD